ncbi:MAG: hypothetical protein LBS35_07775 [Synergistaceae bacterium]|jgi:hypothetical protein|nr:hypothetical protein [Synergistaceae bacterium]
MAAERQKIYSPLISVGLLVLVLMALVSWSLRKNDFESGSFKMRDVRICEELDENLKPVSADRNIPSGSQQVCLWFDYAGARRGDAVEIAWYRGGGMIQRETVRLSAPEGVRAFYLLREDGSPLEEGFYSVTISRNGKDAYEDNFTVAVSSGDMPPGNVVIWD